MMDLQTETHQSPARDQIDWEAELARHDRWLRTVVMARAGEPQAVDETMQELGLAVAAGRALPTDPAKVAPWLYRVAVTQTLLYRRKRGRQRKLVDRYAQRLQPIEEDSSSLDPLGWLLADERKRQVREAMSRLSRRDAEILMLKYSEGWSYREITEHLGISTSAVEARLHRARERLRQQLTAIEAVEVGR